MDLDPSLKADFGSEERYTDPRLRPPLGSWAQLGSMTLCYVSRDVLEAEMHMNTWALMWKPPWTAPL